ncbi:hypothetical protein QBC35DRAFT_456918 [Podospora australis]|uniref:Uncharacterized protein n=1 Tax=Podospora australis TaxID=1536484 RepID=A0AAN6WM25_9PEZI|nr:hypothetical protein QBC35DRAFT_456918 [Podospora australis]
MKAGCSAKLAASQHPHNEISSGLHNRLHCHGSRPTDESSPTAAPRPREATSRLPSSVVSRPAEADAHHWDDDGPPYDKAVGNPNAYSACTVGRHNVILVYMSGMEKANAAAVAANC